MELTQEERKVISQLEKLAEVWPKSLWLFSAGGTLWVMKKKKGEKAMSESGGVDPGYIITGIDIENDGGDW